jgi:hypothetical protein
VATKYQIFVSSTYEDLKHERDRVIQGILEMGHIPVGMEMFSAGDDEQWRIIARHIDESDYYVVIVAHRYGSTSGGVSFTQKEYEYAVSKGIPVIGFIIDAKANWPADRVDTDHDAVDNLKAFKELVGRKPVGFWSTSDDLYGKSSVALTKAFAANPRTGWVRATSVSGPEVVAELSRLSAENAALRERLQTTEEGADREYDLALERDLRVLQNHVVQVEVKYQNSVDWEPAGGLTLGWIFEFLCATLTIEGSVSEVGQLVAVHAPRDEFGQRAVSSPNNLAGKLLTDLMSFDLVEPSPRRHSVNDAQAYWSLTPRGRDLAKLIGRRRIGSGSGGRPKGSPAESASG